jgi:ribosome-binding protein aMBF1 (putative translation factor)
MNNTRKLLIVRKRIEGLERKTKELRKEEEKLISVGVNERLEKVTRFRRKMNMSFESLADKVSMDEKDLIRLLRSSYLPNRVTRVSIANALGTVIGELW